MKLNIKNSMFLQSFSRYSIDKESSNFFYKNRQYGKIQTNLMKYPAKNSGS